MNTCESIFCDCDCFSPKIKTQIILYPAPFNKLKGKQKINNKRSRTHLQVISQSKIQHSAVSQSIIGRISDNTDINSMEHKLKLTIDSITRYGSCHSTQWPQQQKIYNTTVLEQQSIFQDQISHPSRGGHQRKESYASSNNTMNIETSNNKQNQKDRPNVLLIEDRQLDKTKNLKKRNHVAVHFESTKKMNMKISPSCSNLHSLNNTIVQHSNRSSLMSPKIDLTSRLLERQNQQLRSQLHRLQQQEKDLLKQQIYLKQKNSREYKSLKKKSEQLKNRSIQRKSQLRELNKLVMVIKQNKACQGSSEFPIKN